MVEKDWFVAVCRTRIAFRWDEGIKENRVWNKQKKRIDTTREQTSCARVF